MKTSIFQRMCLVETVGSRQKTVHGPWQKIGEYFNQCCDAMYDENKNIKGGCKESSNELCW